MASGKKTGGRQKGTPNRATAAKAEAVAASGLTPLDYMLSVLRNSDDPAERMDAAKAAAPYVHPKLASIEHSGEMKIQNDVSAKPLTEDEWEAQNATPH